jgi:hypothetical protein
MLGFLFRDSPRRRVFEIAVAVAKEYANGVKHGMTESAAQRYALNKVLSPPMTLQKQLPSFQAPDPLEGDLPGDIFKRETVSLPFAILFALRMQEQITAEQLNEYQHSRAFHALVSTFSEL